VCVSVVDWFECGVGVMGSRCGEDIEQVFINFVDRMKTQLGCEDGLFSININQYQ